LTQIATESDIRQHNGWPDFEARDGQVSCFVSRQVPPTV
jgi:hypothetical protein